MLCIYLYLYLKNVFDICPSNLRLIKSCTVSTSLCLAANIKALQPCEHDNLQSFEVDDGLTSRKSFSIEVHWSSVVIFVVAQMLAESRKEVSDYQGIHIQGLNKARFQNWYLQVNFQLKPSYTDQRTSNVIPRVIPVRRLRITLGGKIASCHCIVLRHFCPRWAIGSRILWARDCDEMLNVDLGHASCRWGHSLLMGNPYRKLWTFRLAIAKPNFPACEPERKLLRLTARRDGKNVREAHSPRYLFIISKTFLKLHIFLEISWTQSRTQYHSVFLMWENSVERFFTINILHTTVYIIKQQKSEQLEKSNSIHVHDTTSITFTTTSSLAFNMAYVDWCLIEGMQCKLESNVWQRRHYLLGSIVLSSVAFIAWLLPLPIPSFRDDPVTLA